MKKICSVFFLLSSELLFGGNNYSSTDMVAQTTAGAGAAMFISDAACLSENPSLLTLSTNKPGSVSATLAFGFLNLDSRSTPLTPTAMGEGTSYRDNFQKMTFPQLAGVYHYSNELSFGAAYLMPTGGGSDFKNETAMGSNKTGVGIVNIPISASYKVHENVGVGVSLNMLTGYLESNNSGAKDVTKTDTRFGYSVSGNYSKSEIGTFGFYYFSGANLTFKESILDPYTQTYDDFKMGSPAVLTLAYSYPVLTTLDLSLQLEQNQWSKADNFKDTKWTDENVLIVAGQYRLDERFTIRGGVSQMLSGGMPSEKDKNGDEVAVYQGKSRSVLYRQFVNTRAGGIVTTSLAAGAGMKIMPEMTLDAGFMYGIKKTVEQSGTSTLMGGSYKGKLDMKVSEYFLSLNYVFGA